MRAACVLLAVLGSVVATPASFAEWSVKHGKTYSSPEEYVPAIACSRLTTGGGGGVWLWPRHAFLLLLLGWALPFVVAARCCSCVAS
jgi:hypothetical protein